MQEYRVHYSYFSEEWGNFDDAHYSVEAETPFEAREKAWLAFDKDEETPFRSNVRQFAVTWQPDSLSMGTISTRARRISSNIRDTWLFAAQNSKEGGVYIQHQSITTD